MILNFLIKTIFIHVENSVAEFPEQNFRHNYRGENEHEKENKKIKAGESVENTQNR